jgi:antitoxin (DNA-binding transcriptional repressor) of toxin-antitoxin stability system
VDTIITATELARSLSDILNRVRYKGETFVIQRKGETIATLAPSGPKLGVTLGELAEALGKLTLPGEGFADDLEAIQASQSKSDPPNWPN